MNILVKNGRIVDGTGNPWFFGDIEIEDGKIKQIARKLAVKADRTIDAEGLVVSPGFIDPHCHVDGYCLIHPDMAPYVYQGITTETLGLCGYSPFPDKQTYLEHAGSTPWGTLWWVDEVAKSGYDWNSLTDYRNLAVRIGISIDIAPFIGHGSIGWKAGIRTLKRVAVRKTTATEMDEMRRLTRQGMEEGAFGLSEAMDYAPNMYTDADEIVELAKIVAEYNGILAIHTENVGMPEGIRDAIEIARRAGMQLRIVHIGRRQGYLSGDTNTLPENLALLDRARGEGMDITADVLQTVDFGLSADAFKRSFFFICTRYATEAPKGMESFEGYLEKLKQPDFREEVKQTVIKYAGDSSRYFKQIYEEHMGIYTLINTGNDELEGKTLGKIAKMKGLHPRDIFFDVVFGTSPLLAEGVRPTIIMSMESKADIKKASWHWLTTPSMDMTPRQEPQITPWYGAYITMPRFFRDAVDSGIRMEEAVRKMTSFPAQSWGLYDRGLLRTGMKANVVIFDPDEYRPMADWYNLTALTEGVNTVMVDGKIVLDQGELTKERPGVILTRVQ